MQVIVMELRPQSNTMTSIGLLRSESTTLLISFLLQILVQSQAKCLAELHWKQRVILLCLSMGFVFIVREETYILDQSA